MGAKPCTIGRRDGGLLNASHLRALMAQRRHAGINQSRLFDADFIQGRRAADGGLGQEGGAGDIQGHCGYSLK